MDKSHANQIRFGAEVETCRRNIRRFNDEVNAVILQLDPLADERNARIEAAEAYGEWTGLLHGVPITLKDCFNVAGYNTSFGSAIYRDNIAASNSVVVDRLCQAGAILLAKTNMNEFCYGATGENTAFGNVNNPWDLKRVPGGSSSGAAASVASDMCQIAIGTDTGGSVRIPAAFCGIVGLRPTFGRVPNTGVLPMTLDYDTVGTLARTVSDVARTFAAIAGYDPSDPASSERPLDNFLPTVRAGITGLRLGIPRRFYFDDLQPGVGEAVSEAAKMFENAGARLVDIDIPDAAEAQTQSHVAITRADMADLHRLEMERHADQIGPEVLRRLRLGLEVTGPDYAHSRRWMAGWKMMIRKLFQDVDLILTPTCPIVAPLRADSADMVAITHQVTRFVSALGMVGIPSMSMPCGFGPSGMPVGLMLCGDYFREDLLFRAGAVFQNRTEFHRLRPPLLRN